MKSLLLLPCAVSATLVAPSLEARQLSGLSSLLGGTKVPFAGKKDMAPELNKNAKRMHVKFGPIKLKPRKEALASKKLGTMDPAGQTWTLSFKEGFCTDCSILQGTLGVEDANGKPVSLEDNVYTHHIDTFVNKKANTWISSCDTKDGPGKATTGGTSDIMNLIAVTPFLMMGDDNGNTATTYSSPDGQFKSGFYLPKGATISGISEIVNYSEEPKDLYFYMDMEYMDGKWGSDAKTKLLNIGGCTLRPIELSDKGETRTTSNNFHIYEDGWIVNGKGHLHDGGVKMVLSINNSTACESVASYGGPQGTTIVDGQKWETISAMTSCGQPIPVKKGDNLSMTVVYDLKKHPLRTNGDGHGADVMGMWDLTFASANTASYRRKRIAPLL